MGTIRTRQFHTNLRDVSRKFPTAAGARIVFRDLTDTAALLPAIYDYRRREGQPGAGAYRFPMRCGPQADAYASLAGAARDLIADGGGPDLCRQFVIADAFEAAANLLNPRLCRALP
jgi:hypothetical protein